VRGPRIQTILKLFAGIVMLLTSIKQSCAEGESTRFLFFQQKMSESTVVLGYKFSGAKTHPFCTVNVGWRDGSYLLMSVDLVDEEFWIRVVNNAWSNPNPDYLDTMKVQINFSQASPLSCVRRLSNPGPVVAIFRSSATPFPPIGGYQPKGQRCRLVGRS
jgi:hypothetical protein